LNYVTIKLFQFPRFWEYAILNEVLLTLLCFNLFYLFIYNYLKLIFLRDVICVDYTDLNKVCPKDAYPLLSIDRLGNSAPGNNILSFLYAYSRYNQIPMALADMIKTTFIIEEANYYYKVMPFSLKNVGATYQRLMDKVFSHLIGKSVEVYVDDMVVK